MKPESKRKTVIAVKIIGFVMLLLCTLAALDLLLSPTLSAAKYPYRTYQYNMIYAEKEDSIDVVYMGNSQVYAGISPMKIYSEYGFTGYDLALPLLSPKEAKESINDLFATQSPKLIVLEMTQFFYDDSNIMKYTKGRRLALTLFPFFENHSFWKTGFKPKRDCAKGFQPKKGVHPVSNRPAMSPTDAKYKMNRRFEKCLYEIVDLCRENDVKLMFLTLPGQVAWDYSRHSCIKKYAEESGADFLDLNYGEVCSQLGIDWETDFYDGRDHLNPDGATKVSCYLGKYISENYEITDKRGKTEYSDWDDDLREYNNQTEKNE